jgi:hypothetical protein
MPTNDGSKEEKDEDAWFRAFYVVPDDYKNTKPVQILSHRSKPWVSFQNDLRRASRSCAERFIEGREDGFGLEDGMWWYTFMGTGQAVKGGGRRWSPLGKHSIGYLDMQSSVIGDGGKPGVLVMHVSDLPEISSIVNRRQLALAPTRWSLDEMRVSLRG